MSQSANSLRSPKASVMALLMVLGTTISATNFAASIPDPASDIISVTASSPLADTSTIPGLDDGRAILSRIQEALSLIRSGVPQAAREPLRDARAGVTNLKQNAVDRLPASYRHDGEWWLPVRADRLTVALDTPTMRARRPREDNSPPDTLTTTVLRIDWLPLRSTALHLSSALERIVGGNIGQRRARDQLERATGDIQSNVSFDEPALLNAYYVVESLLATSPKHWSAASNSDLQHAADALANAGSVHAALADKLRDLSKRADLDWSGLNDIGMQLRHALTAPSTPDNTSASANAKPKGVAADVPSDVPLAVTKP